MQLDIDASFKKSCLKKNNLNKKSQVQQSIIDNCDQRDYNFVTLYATSFRLILYTVVSRGRTVITNMNRTTSGCSLQLIIISIIASIGDTLLSTYIK